MSRGRMPRTLEGLPAWYAERWDAEVPDRLHRPGVWRDYGEGASGGSALGSPALSDPFRRYLEDSPSATDADGWFVRPIHAALSRLARRLPLTAQNLFALAGAGMDWRAVAERGHWPEEMYAVFIEEALRRLWLGTFEQVVRSGPSRVA